MSKKNNREAMAKCDTSDGLISNLKSPLKEVELISKLIPPLTELEQLSEKKELDIKTLWDLDECHKTQVATSKN